MMPSLDYVILDISQAVTPQTACFPGDTPFRQQVHLSLEAGESVNLSAFTMSPHVGTHADAPIHIEGSFTEHFKQQPASNQDLSVYIGPCLVVDVSPLDAPITPALVEQALAEHASVPETTHWERVLFKTQRVLDTTVFKPQQASLDQSLIPWLSAKGCRLVGIDTHSVDPVDAKQLLTHHALITHAMAWLENLDLTAAEPGSYLLVALPLKVPTLEAAPVRAVLLQKKV